MDREQLGEWLSAYLDGELAEQDASRVESMLESDGDARDLLEALRATSAAVGALSRRSAPDSIAQAIRADLERDELLDGARPQAEAHMRTASTVTRLATAAVLGFAAIGSLWVIVDRSGVTAPSETAAPLAANAPSDDALALRDVKEAMPLPPSAKANPTVDMDAVAARDRQLTRATSPTLPMQSELPFTMEQKLARGMPVEALQSHRFANEPNRLMVRVDTPEAQRRMALQVRSYLAGRKIVNLEEESEGSAPAEFFKPGRPGVNVYSLEDQQVLIRATPTELSDMIAQFGDPDEQEVVLVLGGVDFSGGSNVQEVFRRSAGVQAPYAAASPSRGVESGNYVQGASAEATERDEESIEGLAGLVGGIAAAMADRANASGAPNDESVDGDDVPLTGASQTDVSQADVSQALVKKDKSETSGELHTADAASSGAETTDAMAYSETKREDAESDADMGEESDAVAAAESAAMAEAETAGLSEDGETRVASKETRSNETMDTPAVASKGSLSVTSNDASPVESVESKDAPTVAVGDTSVAAGDALPDASRNAPTIKSKTSRPAKRKARRPDATAPDATAADAASPDATANEQLAPSSVAAVSRGESEKDNSNTAMVPGKRSRLVDRRLDALESARKQRRIGGRFQRMDDDERLFGQARARAQSAPLTAEGSQAVQLITLVVDFVVAPPRAPSRVGTPGIDVKAKVTKPASKLGQDDKPPSR